MDVSRCPRLLRNWIKMCIRDSNKASLAEGIDPLPMAFPSDDGVPALCGGIWGFGIFDNGDEAKAAAAKEFISMIVFLTFAGSTGRP